MKNKLLGIAVTLVLATVIPGKPAHAVNTGQIIAATADMTCMEFSVVGVCFWLECYPCSVNTSIKYKHYIPEVVVSSYANTGENPWVEMASLSSERSGAEGSGFLITPNRKRDNLPRFKNADVIGHPGGYMFGNDNVTCESATTGFFPYYLSTLDATAWRWGVTEALYYQSLTPGVREIKDGLSNGWGSVYPRQGFLVQPDDGKAGAVMAQRAADFVVRTGQPHVYMSISTAPQQGNGWWPPGYYEDPLKEGDITTHKWQPLHPSVAACTVFPTDEVSPEQDEQGAYAYALWRPYRCCEPEGAFLFSIGQ